LFSKNIHYGHKILEINDEESLKKENITIESSKNEFNNIFTKIKNIKEKIEKEMTEIDNLYDKINFRSNQIIRSKTLKIN